MPDTPGPMATEDDDGLMWVKAGRDLEPGQLALCEDDPLHPADAIGNHQAYVVAGQPPALVWTTAAVRSALAIQRVVATTAPAAAAATAPPAAGAEPMPRAATARGG